jgi:hypothetical protein
MYGRLPLSTRPYCTLRDDQLIPPVQQLRARDLSAPAFDVTDESAGSP